MDLREIDRLVAEKVMGWHRDKDGDWYLPATHEGKLYPAYSGIPEYSTDIAAAWAVVEAMRASGLSVSCRTEPAPSKGQPLFFGVDYGYPCRGSWTARGVAASSMPLAICLAALAAKGVEVPG